jgi:hypothetical protein
MLVYDHTDTFTAPAAVIATVPVATLTAATFPFQY